MDGKNGEASQRGGEALGVGERDFLLAGVDEEIGGANGGAFVFAGNGDGESAGAAGEFESLQGKCGRARVGKNDDGVIRAKRVRIAGEFEGLFGAHGGEAGGEMTEKMFGDLCGVKRAADTDDPEAFFFRGGASGFGDMAGLFREHAADNGGLGVDRVVEMEGMLRARFAHETLFCVFSFASKFENRIPYRETYIVAEERTMARFISLHKLACLTRQGAEELTARMARATSVRMKRVVVNLYEGKMLAEFEAERREALEGWMAEQKFHYDWMMRVEMESAGEELRAV